MEIVGGSELRSCTSPCDYSVPLNMLLHAFIHVHFPCVAQELSFLFFLFFSSCSRTVVRVPSLSALSNSPPLLPSAPTPSSSCVVLLCVKCTAVESALCGQTIAIVFQRLCSRSFGSGHAFLGSPRQLPIAGGCLEGFAQLSQGSGAWLRCFGRFCRLDSSEGKDPMPKRLKKRQIKPVSLKSRRV